MLLLLSISLVVARKASTESDLPGMMIDLKENKSNKKIVFDVFKD